ncbi:hypothetical protein AGMMS50239_30890 [Bacteroidia bacterium]|nr:hypothetical protein AGMMS50239_30890 [Bacteroidia bacterium]
MKRVNIYWLLLDSLFLIVFNLLFFMLGDSGDAKTSVWISYGFIHFAYLAMLLTPLLVRRSSAEQDYGRPLYVITSAYFLTELVAGVTLILIAPETVKVTIIIQAVLAAVFIGWLLVHLIANEHTAAATVQREAELLYVKESSAILQSVLSRTTDKTAAKKVERLYDLIHSSPVKSTDNVCSLEQQIINEIELLNNIGQNEIEKIIATAEKLYQLAEERNRQLKTNNR